MPTADETVLRTYPLDGGTATLRQKKTGDYMVEVEGPGDRYVLGVAETPKAAEEAALGHDDDWLHLEANEENMTEEEKDE